MQIKNRLLDLCIFLLDDDCTDIFALVIDHLKIHSLDEMIFDKLFLGKDGVDVVWILVGSNDTFPSSLEIFLKGFH